MSDGPSIDLALTFKQRARGKRFYYLFAFFNSFSWASLAEGVVILMLLRMGATEAWVGLVAALQYVTLPVMVLGYATVPRLGVTGTAALFWAIRSFSAVLMILAPWTQRLGGNSPLWFMFFGSLGFMLGRAGGLTPFTGIVTELTTERDRGVFLSGMGGRRLPSTSSPRVYMRPATIRLARTTCSPAHTRCPFATNSSIW